MMDFTEETKLEASINFDQCTDDLEHRVKQLLRKIIHATNRTLEELTDIDVSISGFYDSYLQMYYMTINHENTKYISICVNTNTTDILFCERTHISADGVASNVTPSIIRYLDNVLKSEKTYYQVSSEDGTPADYLSGDVPSSWKTSVFSSEEVAKKYADNWSRGMCPMSIHEVRI